MRSTLICHDSPLTHAQKLASRGDTCCPCQQTAFTKPRVCHIFFEISVGTNPRTGTVRAPTQELDFCFNIALSVSGAPTQELVFFRYVSAQPHGQVLVNRQCKRRSVTDGHVQPIERLVASGSHSELLRKQYDSLRFYKLLETCRSMAFDLLETKTKRNNFEPYAHRVFIMDNGGELMPEWLSFVKSAVDPDEDGCEQSYEQFGKCMRLCSLSCSFQFIGDKTKRSNFKLYARGVVTMDDCEELRPE